MDLRRVVWFGISVLALASWMASASTSVVRPPVAPLPPVTPGAVDRSMAALQSEIGRLHERLAPTAAPTRSRDLFRFTTRAPRRAVVAPPVAEAEAIVPVPPVRPSLTLIGVAEDVTPDGVVRTAIVSGFGDVFLVKAGDTIRLQYRVELVSGDAVQVVDTATAAATTLALR
ncbi:MAG: hypothetical protein ABL982_10300 [Vicinamibacterales bacterium]